ncbi:MAG: hypothetical protein ACTHLZ_09280 [Tepidisphaeraceae bacterium]
MTKSQPGKQSLNQKSLQVSLVMLAGILISTALSLHGRFPLQLDVVLLALSILSALGACCVRSAAGGMELNRSHRTMVALGAICAGICWLILRPSVYVRYVSEFDTIVVPSFVVISLVIFCMFGLPVGRIVRWPIYLCAGLLMVILAWTIQRTPSPPIDAWVFAQRSCAALLQHLNPYAIHMPNIYGPGTPFYRPEEISGQEVMRGYSYPPFTLFAVLPFYLLFNDHRWAYAIFTVSAALVVAHIRRSQLSVCAAFLILLCPFSAQQVSSAWTEPLQLLCLTLTVWCAINRPRWTAVLFGLFLAGKQYTPFFLPAGLFLLPKPWKLKSVANFYSVALGIASLVSLPLVLIDPNAFLRSAVLPLLHGGMRFDSLSFFAAFLHEPQQPPTWLAYVYVVSVYALCFRFLPTGIFSFCLSLGTAGIGLFAFNKYAFGNYYYLLMGSLFASLATLEERVEQPLPASPGAR